MLMASLTLAAPAAAHQVRVSARAQDLDSLVVLRDQLQRVTLTQRVLVRDLKTASAALGRAATETEKSNFRARVADLSARLGRNQQVAEMLQFHLTEMCAAQPAPEGWLGINISDAADITASPSATTFAFVKYPTLVSVEPGSPAQKAGLSSGDLIVALGGRDMVSGAMDVRSLLKPGVSLAVRLRRDGELRTVNVLVEPRPEGFNSGCPWIEISAMPVVAARPKMRFMQLPDGGFAYAFGDSSGPKVLERAAPPGRGTPVLPPTPHVPFRLQGSIAGANMFFAGAVLMPLNEDLREGLGIDEGILVVDVLRGSPALDAGLRPGDIITRVNGQKLQSIVGLIAALDEARDREVEFQVSSKRSAKPRIVRLRP